MLHTTKRLLQFAILMMVACKGGAVVLSTTYIGVSVISIIEGAVFEKTEGPTGRGILRAPASVPA
jgi:hypothetical protein